MNPGQLKLALLRCRLLRIATLDRMKGDGLLLGNHSVERFAMPRDELRELLAAGGHYDGGDDIGQLRQLYAGIREIGLTIRQTSKRVEGKHRKVWIVHGICNPAIDILHWDSRTNARTVDPAWLDWTLAHQALYDFPGAGERYADDLFDGWRDFDWRQWQARADAANELADRAAMREAIERQPVCRERKAPDAPAAPLADDKPVWVREAEAEDAHRDNVTEQLNAVGWRLIEERTERRRLPNGRARDVLVKRSHAAPVVLAYGKRERKAGKCDAIIDEWRAGGGGTDSLRNDIAWLRDGLRFAGCAVQWERVKDDAGEWTERLMVRGLQRRRGPRRGVV